MDQHHFEDEQQNPFDQKKPADTAVLTNQDISNLVTTGKWGKFLSVFTFIMAGFMFLGGLLLLIAGDEMVGSGYERFPVRWMGPVYMVASLLYFFPGLFLFRFSRSMVSLGKGQTDPGNVGYGIANLKSLFVFMGVTLLVVLGLYALSIIMAIFIGIFS